MKTIPSVDSMDLMSELKVPDRSCASEMSDASRALLARTRGGSEVADAGDKDCASAYGGKSAAARSSGTNLKSPTVIAILASPPDRSPPFVIGGANSG